VLGTVTSDEAWSVALSGNRNYLHRVLSDMHEEHLKDADIEEILAQSASSQSDELSSPN
jgi:hypothetical protein